MFKKHKLSVFVVAMLTFAMVMSLRGLPIIAKEGTTMFFYLFFATFLFLVPVSLVSAELATGWPEGGVYRWVKEAFGPGAGFIAIWLQWSQNMIWYATVLAFATATLSYVFFNPALGNNPIYIILTSLLIYWSATFINFCGLKAASWTTTLFVISGTIFPGLLIITFGLIWIFQGHPLVFWQNAPHRLIPDLSNLGNVAFLAGTVVLFSGMEVSAVHAKEMNNPAKDYPKAIFLSMIVIILIFSLGAVAIAAIIPSTSISLTEGIMQGLQYLLSQFYIEWLLPVLGFLVAFGTIGGIIAWIGGPSKGLLLTAKDGELPLFLQHVNKNGIQTHILWIQGLIVMVLLLTFLFFSDVSVAFFLLTSLTATLYLFMYLLLYTAAIRLKYSKPDVYRAYQVPGGKSGMCLLAGIGIAAILFAIIVSYFPPSQLPIQNPTFYVWFMITFSLLFLLIPIFIHVFQHKKGKKSRSK